MLAPLRDYLCPKNSMSSPLLCKIKDVYFHQLSANFFPDKPGHKGAQWIVENVNIYWHKPQLVIFGPKVEGLLDEHPSKPQCLFQLSWLFDPVGNTVEYKRLLICTLTLWEGRNNNLQVA